MRGHPGVSALVQAMQRTARSVQPKGVWLDYGVILGDGSLQTDRFRQPIPPGSYRRLRPDTLLDPMTVTLTAGAHEGHGGHVHDVVRPLALEPFLPGDQVLVAWLLDGTEPLVLGVVVDT